MIVNFETNAINANDAALGANIAEFDFEFEGEIIKAAFIAERTNRFFNFNYKNENENQVRMDYKISITGNRSQMIHSSFVIVPPNHTFFVNFDFTNSSIDDIESTIISPEDDLLDACFVLGSTKLTPGYGLAAGKLIVELETLESYKIKELEYTLNNNCLVLNWEADNISNKNVRMTISNCYLYNTDGENLMEMNELLQFALLPGDRYDITIEITPVGAAANLQRK